MNKNENKKIVEVFNSTIHHWKKMADWANLEGEKKIVSPTVMETFLKESPTTTFCPMCTYIDLDCFRCPLTEVIGSCSTNLYPAPSKYTTWKAWAKDAYKFIKQLRYARDTYISIYAPKPLDWTKPLRWVEDRKEVKEVPGHMIKHPNSWNFLVDDEGRDFKHKSKKVENIPEEDLYIPVSIGDRVTIDGLEWIISSMGLGLGLGSVGLINLETGLVYGNKEQVLNKYSIPFISFKNLVSPHMWEKVYSTLKRRKK